MKFKITILFISLFLMSATLTNAAFAYTQVLGSKDTAPGQQKKVNVNIGRVENVEEDKIEIKGQGKKTEVNTNPQTSVITKPKNQKIESKQIKKNDLIASIESTESAEATEGGKKGKKLVLVRESTETAKPETRRRAVYGLVRAINGNIITLSHPIKDNPRYNVEVIDATVIKIKGITSPTIGDIKIGDRVAAVGNWSENNLVAKRVHVIPGKAIGLLNKVGTPSATTSASPIPSAVPSSSPSDLISPAPSSF